MGHSDSLKDVPNINSNEFEKFLADNDKGSETFLENNGIDPKIFKKDFTNKHEDGLNNPSENNSTINQPKKESIVKIIFKMIDNWCMENPGPSLTIFLGGSAFICYKMTVGIISQGVFKGNLKTSRYFDKHAG